MSELSRSLVDAAAEALPDAFMHAVGDVDRFKDRWQLEARAAVAAVLETLAAHIAGQPVELVDLMGNGIPFNEGKSSVVDLMRRMATEVREET